MFLSTDLYQFIIKVIFPADGFRDVPDGVEVWLVHLSLSSHELPSLGAESVEQGVCKKLISI